MKRIGLIFLLLFGVVLLTGCSSLDEEGLRSLERVGVTHVVRDQRILVTEVKDPAAQGWAFPIKYKGEAAAAVIADDHEQLLTAMNAVSSLRLVPLDAYVGSAEYGKALSKAKKRSVSTLQPLMDQENLDGVLWLNRTYYVFARSTLIRWEKYWWYAAIATDARLYDREGNLVLRHSWQNYGRAANLSPRPTEEEAIAALAEANVTADQDVAEFLSSSFSAGAIPELGDPRPEIPRKWLLDLAIFVRGALIAGILLLGLGLIGAVKERGGCIAVVFGIALLAGAVYLLGWHGWWRDVWKFIEIIGEMAE